MVVHQQHFHIIDSDVLGLLLIKSKKSACSFGFGAPTDKEVFVLTLLILMIGWLGALYYLILRPAALALTPQTNNKSKRPRELLLRSIYGLYSTDNRTLLAISGRQYTNTSLSSMNA